MSFKALKKVDERYKLLLFGYNRKHHQNVPIPVTYLCISYYFEYDKWNKLLISPAIELKNDGAIIEHIGDPKGRITSCNAYLTNIWKSGKCQWKFKVINLH